MCPVGLMRLVQPDWLPEVPDWPGYPDWPLDDEPGELEGSVEVWARAPITRHETQSAVSSCFLINRLSFVFDCVPGKRRDDAACALMPTLNGAGLVSIGQKPP